MRGSISRALLFVGCSVGAALAMAGPAQAASSRAGATPDFGSPPGHGSVTCQAFAFDPDPGVLITARVTLDGTVFPPETQPGSYLHQATWTWTASEKLVLDQPGPHHWSIALTWNVGTGTTTVTGDLTCAEEPTTTTTTTVEPPTTVAPPTTAQVKASEVGLATGSNTASKGADQTEVEGTALPNTGSDSGPLLLLGGGFIAVGSLAVRGSRRWRSAR